MIFGTYHKGHPYTTPMYGHGRGQIDFDLSTIDLQQNQARC